MLHHFKGLLCNGESTTKELTSAFWEGKRWLVFDTSKKMLGMQDLECFGHYDEAVHVCTANRVANPAYKIVSLGRLLKILSQIPRHVLSNDQYEDFFIALGQTPASLCRPFCDYIDSLRSNDYFPLYKNTVINPLTLIETYHVVNVPAPKAVTQNSAGGIGSGSDIQSSFESFEEALEAFSTTASGTGHGTARYLLIGQFMHKTLELAHDGMPVRNTGMALFRSIKSKNGQNIQIEQMNDITSPFVLRYGVFARYRKETKKIDCYDGALKKGKFGTILESMDFRHYLFG